MTTAIGPALSIPTGTQDQQNFLLNTKAVLTIDAIENFQLYCTGFNLPGMVTRSADVVTPFATVKLIGDHVTFENLNVFFMVRQDLSNWLVLQRWMYGVTRPSDFKQFKERKLTYSDGTLFILDANNTLTQEFRFINLSLEMLSGLEFTTQGDSTPIKSSASLTFDWYYGVDKPAV